MRDCAIEIEINRLNEGVRGRFVYMWVSCISLNIVFLLLLPIATIPVAITFRTSLFAIRSQRSIWIWQAIHSL